ncbi:MAG: penicillin-binding protein 1B, partial [Pseudomonadota bacterium]
TPLQAIRAALSTDGTQLQRYPLTIRQAADPAATFIVNTILQETMRFGTGQSAYAFLPYDWSVVGKTGTTNDLRDSWFAGFSGDYLSVVWVGRDDNKTAGLTGSAGALQIWAETMKQISKQPVILVPPDDIEMTWIDPENGLRANERCFGARLYPYISGSAPQQYSPCVTSATYRSRPWYDRFFP